MLHQRRRHVTAGSFHVGRSQPTSLRACLGTCVGVTICDPEAGVGGLIHLLLPEPVSTEGTHDPERYASLGLPLFLQALCKAGASCENLKACVAGGALIGPLDERDLALDIGGRTADTVRLILDRAGIDVVDLETGGLFSCSLDLNMSTWESTVEPMGSVQDDPGGRGAAPSPEEISRAVDQVQSIPQVALRILRLTDQDDYGMLDVAEELKQDQVLSARTLQLGNSAMFRRGEIESLEHALVLLGQELVVKLVVSAAVRTFFDSHSEGYSLCKGGLYHHAIGTAVVAEKLAVFTGVAPPAAAYTAGLLHDIGKVVLDQYVMAGSPFFYREHLAKETFLDAERRTLDTDHTHVGAMLGHRWKLSESLTDVIRHHHRPEAATHGPELTHLVYLADLLMSRFRTGLELERLGTRALDARLRAVGLSISQIPDVIDLIPKEVFEASSEIGVQG